MHRPQKLAASALLLLVGLLRPVSAQTPAAAKPDPNQLLTAWNQIERYPPRAEKDCLRDAVLLYAPSDKPNSLQVVSACAMKDGNWSFWNYRGSINPNGDGRFKLISLWPFHTGYRIFAIAPDSSWALVGSTNHHSLWVLAKSTTLPTEVLAGIEAKATAAGFNTAKLKKMPRTQ